LQDNPDLRMVARVSYTFHLDPIQVMNDYGPVQLAALLAAHNVVADDERSSVAAHREEMARLREQAGLARR